jgi:hypothetical protein
MIVVTAVTAVMMLRLLQSPRLPPRSLILTVLTAIVAVPLRAKTVVMIVIEGEGKEGRWEERSALFILYSVFTPYVTRYPAQAGEPTCVGRLIKWDY